MILYWPARSVVVDRVFSIRAGLDTSTVTPGTTAPLASLTVPAMAVSWADTALDTPKRKRSVKSERLTGLTIPASCAGMTVKESVRARILSPRHGGTLEKALHVPATTVALTGPPRRDDDRQTSRVKSGLPRRSGLRLEVGSQTSQS